MKLHWHDFQITTTRVLMIELIIDLWLESASPYTKGGLSVISASFYPEIYLHVKMLKNDSQDKISPKSMFCLVWCFAGCFAKKHANLFRLIGLQKG